MTDRVCVGAIAGAFGVRGEVRLKSFCNDPAAIGDYSPLEAEDGSRSFDIVLDRPVKNGFAARIRGVNDKDVAEGLRGIRLFVPRDRLPGLDQDEYYHADLINLEVVDTGGTPLGRVKAVLNHGAADLLEIALIGSPKTVLLPFTLAAVPAVDIAAKRIVADPPDGLFADD